MATHPPAFVRRYLLAGAASFLLVTGAGCAQTPSPSPAAMPAIPPGQARIWVYRDYQPSESLNMAGVAINGAIAGYAQPGGGFFYRDVAPGHYEIAVQSFGTDFGQSSDVDLAAGQEAYVKIESLSAWTTWGDLSSIKRDTFYARLIPAQLARTEMAHLTPYRGG